MTEDGRRILLMVAAGDRSIVAIEESAAAVAGNFDYYIYRGPYGRIEHIVDREKSHVRALEIARSRGLLVVFTGSYYVKTLGNMKKTPGITAA